MTKTEIISKLENVFKEVMEIDYFEKSFNMNNVDRWDSLKHISLIMEIEKDFNIQFRHNDIISMTSVDIIVDIISKTLSIKNG